jgi:hypothetical protein
MTLSSRFNATQYATSIRALDGKNKDKAAYFSASASGALWNFCAGAFSSSNLVQFCEVESKRRKSAKIRSAHKALKVTLDSMVNKLFVTVDSNLNVVKMPGFRGLNSPKTTENQVKELESAIALFEEKLFYTVQKAWEPEATEATEATEPTEPTEATEATEATEPTEPTEPTEATEATEPEKLRKSLQEVTSSLLLFQWQSGVEKKESEKVINGLSDLLDTALSGIDRLKDDNYDLSLQVEKLTTLLTTAENTKKPVSRKKVA